MSAGSRDGRYISECIFGQQTGATELRKLQSFASEPDQLFKAVCEAIDKGDTSRGRLQGLLRAFQKHIEALHEAAR